MVYNNKVSPAKLIVPRGLFFNIPAWNDAIQTALDMGAEDIRIDFQVTVRTWKGKPEFTITNKDNGYSRWIGTTSDIYRFITRGTRVRYAHMTPGFIAKTAWGVIASYPGRGGLAYVNTKLPLPGIEARDFEGVIERKWTKRFPELLQRAMNTQARKMGLR